MGKLYLSLFIVGIFMIVAPITGNDGAQEKNPKGGKIIADQDSDLKEYPEYYRLRVMAFRGIMREQRTKEAKIAKAIRILKDEDSPYRRDAIQFVAEIKAKEAVNALVEAGEDKDLRSEAAFAIGQIKDKRGIDFLIRCLYDDSDNVRGNASTALQKITGRQFGYDYSGPEDSRKRSAKLWEKWWEDNKKTFIVQDLTEEERRDAEVKWEKYGKKYIERVLKE